MSQQRSAGVSIRQYRISAARWRLFKGKIFVPFSGHWGDCGAYHGFVVGVSIVEPGKVTSFSTRARGGGIWAQGGVSGDGQSLFAVTGNTFGTTGWFGATEWSDGEAVLRLSPDLARPIDAGPDIRVPHRARFHQIDAAARQLRQGCFQAGEPAEERQTVTGHELYQKIGVA